MKFQIQQIGENKYQAANGFIGSMEEIQGLLAPGYTIEILPVEVRQDFTPDTAGDIAGQGESVAQITADNIGVEAATIEDECRRIIQNLFNTILAMDMKTRLVLLSVAVGEFESKIAAALSDNG